MTEFLRDPCICFDWELFSLADVPRVGSIYDIWMEALDLRLLTDVTNLTSPNSNMGPKPKGRLGRPHQQGTAGKRSPKKRAKRRIEDEEDSDDETLGKGKLPSRGQRESRNKYSLSMKVQAIERMASGKMVSSVSDEMGIPVGMVSQWWLQRDDIRSAYEREVLRESGQDMVEEHIRMSQEDFDRKRMEKFLASNPDRPAMFQPHKRQHPADPLSDDSVADPDEDFSAEEYMRKRKKATPSPSSEEDVGSWSMSFVDKSPSVKSKHVAKNKIKDMPGVKDSQKLISKVKVKEIDPQTKGKRSSNSPKKGGSGSSGRMMNQIKKIKKDQRKKRKDNPSSLKTSTYEVKEATSVPSKGKKSPEIEVPGWRVVESPSRSISPPINNRALSPSPPPDKEAESGSSSLIIQSPSRAQEPKISRISANNELELDQMVSKVKVAASDPNGGCSLETLPAKIKTEPASKSPPLKVSADPPPARNVKSEPAEEYVESREADASSIASEDGNLMDFLEKVKKPDNNELVNRYYSPFGLKTGEGRPKQVNLKTEMVSPLKSVATEHQEYLEDSRHEEDKGAVSPPRIDLLTAYPAIQLAPSNVPANIQHVSPAMNALQRIPGLEVRPPSKERSQNQLRGSPLVRKPSIEEIGEVIAQPPAYPQPIIQRGRGGGRVRGRARGPHQMVRPMSPQVRAPMARGTLPPGVRMRMRGQQQPPRGRGRGEVRPTMARMPAGQSPILGGRGRIVQRGQLTQVRGVLRGQPAGRVLPGRGRAPLRGVVRPQIIRGVGPQRPAQPMRARHAGPRMMSNIQSPRAAAGLGYQAPQAYIRAPQGQRYAQPGVANRFPSPRGTFSPGTARGLAPHRGGPVRGRPMIRAPGPPPPAQALPGQARPGEAKRKVTVELSDSQLAALKSLGIM